MAGGEEKSAGTACVVYKYRIFASCSVPIYFITKSCALVITAQALPDPQAESQHQAKAKLLFTLIKGCLHSTTKLMHTYWTFFQRSVLSLIKRQAFHYSLVFCSCMFKWYIAV